MSLPRLAWAMSLGVGVGMGPIAACSTADPGPSMSSTLDGLYVSTGSGEVAAIAFFGGSRYLLWRNDRAVPCPTPEDPGACAESGTYAVGAETLRLTEGVTGDSTEFSFKARPARRGDTGLRPTALLEAQGPLLEDKGSRLLDFELSSSAGSQVLVQPTEGELLTCGQTQGVWNTISRTDCSTPPTRCADGTNPRPLPGGSRCRKDGCPSRPSCEDRSSTTGELCLEVCDPTCRVRRAHFGFWASPYTVPGTLDVARHQGIAIVGAELSFDPRANAPKEGTGSWAQATLGNLPPDVLDTIVRSRVSVPGALLASPANTYAMCTPPRLIVDRALGNHGRAMTRDPSASKSRREIEPFDVDSLPPGANDEQARSARIAQCVSDIPDGFCDVACGNCSYTLPSPCIAASRSGDWSKPESKLWGPGGCNPEESYYGGPGVDAVSSSFGNTPKNPFTHCALLGCEEENYEAPGWNWVLPGSDFFVSGLYGHNSNTDAEAELTAYLQCARETGAPQTSACGVCGQVRADRQHPCLDKTNTATLSWTRTSDVESLRDASDSGTTTTLPPRCRWAPHDVLGM